MTTEKTTESAAPVSKKLLWAGRVVSTLPVLGLVMSAAMKLAKITEAVEGLAKLGYPAHVLVPLGVVELACTILYVIPRTAVLGAILLTGYLGGATATHVRASESFAAPVVMGVLVWLGLFLRDRRIRDLIPLRS